MESVFKYIISTILVLFAVFEGAAGSPANKITGRITDTRTAEAIPGVVIGLEGTYLWAVADQSGRFVIPDIQSGNYTLLASCLGYATRTLAVTVQNDVYVDISLVERTLAIEEVVVTGRLSKDDPNTAMIIGREALDHLQLSNVVDAAALLPGGKTINPDLTSENAFSVRGGGSSAGNSYFGTAVEVDGVRIGNNASFGRPGGIDTRNIAVTNIESIEVITGVPSAEYGDLNSGMVRINTRKGRTPWNATLAVNPRTEQVSFSKGLDLGDGKGVINLSSEWTHATKKLTSPYTSYVRRGVSMGYSNTFRRTLKFDIGVVGNMGGMNTEDDPDAYSGQYTKVHDNVLRANTSLLWLLNKPWITNLKFEASVNYNDNRTHARTYHSEGSEQPSVHAAEEGYFPADKLPYSYFADQIVDSRELDYAASLKYEWNRRWGGIRNNLKAGVQWKATGNVGEGEYYLDPSLAPNGYRPRPYADYPYMHNAAFFLEESFSFPVGNTTLQLIAGLRLENVFIRGTEYNNLRTLSPRFNARWRFSDSFSIRGGWGITEKLPSYYVLYPRQEYRDIQTFGFSYDNNKSSYVYYTQPYIDRHNAGLKWQRNHNAELGVDMVFGGIKVSLVGYYNRTKLPYKYSNAYTPFPVSMLKVPFGYTMPSNPEVKVDSQTGMVYVRGDSMDSWTEMEVNVVNRTFVNSTYSDNGSDIIRSGAEMIVDFPEIPPVSTRFRFDAAYGYTKYVDDALSWYYQNGWSHTSLANRSYQYAGIYAAGGGSSTVNGKRTHSLDANITAITHIPRARIIITCRLEMSLVKRSQNLSEYKGKEYAFNVTESSNVPVGGSIYGGNSYTAIWPVAYVDLDGTVHPFTEAQADDTDFANLIIKSGNVYTFAKDGYDPYFSANISITKEIGNHVSLSFFANNFTDAPRYKRSLATGMDYIVSAIPEFYYGLTCRIKF